MYPSDNHRNPLEQDAGVNTMKLLLALGMLLTFCFGLLCICSLLTLLPKLFCELPQRTEILLASTLQNILAFAGSALLASYFISKGNMARFMRIDRLPDTKNVCGVVLLLLLALPALNQIIYWNSEMHLPEAASGLEKTLRTWEESNAALSEKLLAIEGISGLIVNVLIIGVLTGICEEFFFRGALQRIFYKYGMGHHGAIWLSAFIFSAAHFQFFGFVPRLLLGACFGYLLYSTGSLWTSALAHAINNSIVVVTSWLTLRGMTSFDFENIGVNTSGFPWFAIMSAVAVAAFCYFLWPLMLNNRNKHQTFHSNL